MANSTLNPQVQKSVLQFIDSLNAALQLIDRANAVRPLIDSFKMAENGFKRFGSVITEVGKSAGEKVYDLASRLESLYFVSQRTGAAAGNLKAFDYAARNAGLSTEAAYGAVENLSKALHDPKSEGYLKSLGVQTRGANGDLRDTANILADVGKKLSGMPASKLSEASKKLGVDEGVLKAAGSSEFAPAMQQYQKAAGNTDLGKATQEAHAFMGITREIGAQFETFGITVEAQLLHAIGPQLEAFSKWFQENGPTIAARVADMAAAFVNAAANLGPLIGWVIDQFSSLDKSTDGWSTTLLALVVVFQRLGGFQIVGGILGMVGAIRNLLSTGSGIQALIGLLGDAMGGVRNVLGGVRAIVGAAKSPVGMVAGAASAGWAAGTWINNNVVSKVPGLGDKIGEGVARVASLFGSKEASDALAYNRKAAVPPPAGPGLPPGQADSTDASQVNAANYGLAQHIDGRAGLLQRATQNTQQTSDMLVHSYEQPAQAALDASRGSAGDGGGSGRAAQVGVSQQTTIHVHGVSDAASVGKAVADHQGRVNDDLVRNTKAAYQ